MYDIRPGTISPWYIWPDAFTPFTITPGYITPRLDTCAISPGRLVRDKSRFNRSDYHTICRRVVARVKTFNFAPNVVKSLSVGNLEVKDNFCLNFIDKDFACEQRCKMRSLKHHNQLNSPANSRSENRHSFLKYCVQM